MSSFSASYSEESAFVDPTGETAHRSRPLPDVPWTQRMCWHDHLFVHWPLEPGALRELVPRSLSVDTFEDVGWVGINAFRLSRVGLRYLPDLPLASSSLALAVRTYVKTGGLPGIWFFSIDVSNKLIGLVGRRFLGVPFFNANMSLESGPIGTSFWSERADRRAHAIKFDALYSPFGDSFRPERGSLEAFLTERYCFYTEAAGRTLHRTELHHSPWLLQPVTGTCLLNDYLSCHGIETPAALPLLHTAGKVDVVLYPPTKVS